MSLISRGRDARFSSRDIHHATTTNYMRTTSSLVYNRFVQSMALRSIGRYQIEPFPSLFITPFGPFPTLSLIREMLWRRSANTHIRDLTYHQHSSQTQMQMQSNYEGMDLPHNDIPQEIMKYKYKPISQSNHP
jgi:hypothetical protein